VWNLLPSVPASNVAGTVLAEMVVLDVNATLVSAHSEKEQAAATFKGGFGFHPLGVWSDKTTELLAVTLRPGNAGSVRHEVARDEWTHRLEVRLMSKV
jgi:Transposase DDE domain group 1